MPSLKELKNRISSVKATQKITKAMKMVAAAKLRRAQEAAEASRPYSERMGKVISSLVSNLSSSDEAPALMVGTGNDKKHLLVVATAERGLCGGFNSSIAKLAREHAMKLQRDGREVKIICVGKKGHDALKRQFANSIIDVVDLRSVKRISFSDASKISKQILQMFDTKEFDVCTLFFARFKSVIAQEPTGLRLIPAEVYPDEGGGSDKQPVVDAPYDYEPSEIEILNDLLPRNIAVQIFNALLENAASEQGARMSAMDNATRNAGEMIDKLGLQYNRSRQAQITKELIEIISGAEAL